MAHKKLPSHWEHRGSYSVVVTDDAPTHHLPGGASIEGKTIFVQNGRIKQVANGIMFYVNECPFFWSNWAIEEIRDGNGNIIWIREK